MTLFSSSQHGGLLASSNVCGLLCLVSLEVLWAAAAECVTRYCSVGAMLWETAAPTDFWL